VYAIPSSEDGKKQNESVHTPSFLKMFRLVDKKRIKNALEIGYRHFKRSPSFNVFMIPTIHKIFNQMDCLKIG